MLDAYLSTRSIGGLSGSPVFLNYGGVRVDPQTQRFRMLQRPEFALLGLLHGHKKIQDDEVDPASATDSDLINAGIAIVIPAHRIRETIDEARTVAATESAGATDPPAEPVGP